jgi:hypothetical protein
MGRRRDENYTLQKIIQYRIQWELKKMYSHFVTPIKQ